MRLQRDRITRHTTEGQRDYRLHYHLLWLLKKVKGRNRVIDECHASDDHVSCVAIPQLDCTFHLDTFTSALLLLTSLFFKKVNQLNDSNSVVNT